MGTTAPLAQLAEQLTLNQRVRGSSPWRRTTQTPCLIWAFATTEDQEIDPSSGSLGAAQGASTLEPMSVAVPDGRQRGRIEHRGNALRVSVYGGLDPVSGKRVYLRETIQGTDRAAERKARSAMARLVARVDGQRSPQSSAKLAHALDEFMRVSELEHTTRDSYDGFIRRLIKPALGDLPVARLGAQHLESLYAELRRCRLRCDGQPFVEHHTAEPHECRETRHRKRRPHDCQAAGCRTVVRCHAHECRPLSASSIRQIHSILSGALSLAE